MAGCTLEDCLKRFVVAERVENYHCSNCWHLAATKYLSTLGRSETDVRKLMSCTRQDNCDCKHIAGVEAIPWSNNFSHTVKQLSIARCPKVICIHLQRAWMNYVGEPVKLQGHIDFPLCLDLHPYMKNGVGLKNSKDPGQGKHVKQQLRQRVLHTNYSLQLDSCLVNCTNILRGKNFSSGLVDADEVGSASTSLHVQEEACSFPVGKGYSEPKVAETRRDLERKMSANCTMAPVPVKSHTYHLVSVVEHFGRAGCGHYTVYRRVKDKPVQEDPAKQMKPFPSRWFCISDSEVFSVLEKDVLAVEASLLFYERIVEC